MRLILFVFLFSGILLSQQLNNPESIVYDKHTATYLVSNASGGDIIRRSSSGTFTVFASGINSPKGMVVLNDTVYVTAVNTVKGYNIHNGQQVMSVQVPGASFLNDIAADSSFNLYISDSNTGKIHKLNALTKILTTFVSSGLSSPNGLLYDHPNNRLLLCSFRNKSPIQAISLTNSSVSTVKTTNISNMDGLAADDSGFVYVSSWGSSSVFKFDANWNSTVFSAGHAGPADIFYNKYTKQLVVPNMNSNTISFLDVVTDLKNEEIILPESIRLFQNYPNPFNPSTVIRYSIKNEQFISLKVYDILGRETAVLVNEIKEPGSYEVNFDAINLSSGIYFYKLTAGGKTEIKKMMLQK